MSVSCIRLKRNSAVLAVFSALSLAFASAAWARTLADVQEDLDVAYSAYYEAVDRESQAYQLYGNIVSRCAGSSAYYECYANLWDEASNAISQAQMDIASAESTIGTLWDEYYRIANGGG